MADPRLRVDGHRFDVAEGRRLDRPDRRRTARLDDLGQLLGRRVGNGRLRREKRKLTFGFDELSTPATPVSAYVRSKTRIDGPTFIVTLPDPVPTVSTPFVTLAEPRGRPCPWGWAFFVAVAVGTGVGEGVGRHRPRRRSAHPEGHFLFGLGSARGQAHRRREHNNHEPRKSHPRPPGEEPESRSPPCPS